MEVNSNLGLNEAVDMYLNDLRINRRDTTVNRADQILREFAVVVGRKPLALVDRHDISRFLSTRKEVGNVNRTLWNKSTRILALLRHHGFTLKYDKPRYTEPIPEIYDEAKLGRFFAACEFRHLVYFKLLLMTGIRMQESKYLHWTDIENGMLHVKSHPPFVPKTWEERRIPLALALQDLLRRLPRREGPLVFPTAKGLPDKHLLRHCKRMAKKAGLDPSDWSLHGFRRTFCTSLLRSGMDARSVMQLMGHADIESTLRYWRPLEIESLRAKVDSVFS